MPAAASRASTRVRLSPTPSAPPARPSSSARRPRVLRRSAPCTPRPSPAWWSRRCRCRTTCRPRRWPGRSRSPAMSPPRSTAPPIAPASFESSAQAVIGALKHARVDTSAVTLSDSSGLSRDDRIPAGVLTGVIKGAADGSLGSASALLSGLPVAGYDGTLADRGDDDPATAPGTVRAKTGTLQGVHALAGTVVTADGRLLAFAVVADAATGGEAAAEGTLDRSAATMAGCGCR